MGINGDLDEDLDQLLAVAVETGNTDQVVTLIEKYKQNVHQYRCAPNINNCLIQSVEQENWALTNLFLTKYHADVNTEKVNSRTRPIHIVAASGNVDIAKEILNRGSLVNIPNGQGKYPLQIAVDNNHTKMVELLVSEGAAINRTGSVRSGKWEHPLHTCIKNNNWDIFDILIKKGARINTVNYKGETCIHYAIKHKQFTILQKLCAKGADVNIGNPLRLALLANSFQMAAILISHGAKVNAKNEIGETVLSDLPMVFKKDVSRKSELHQFVYEKILLGSKDVINLRDGHGFAPLHHAVMAGTIEFTRMLLDNGADINVVSPDNISPLFIAIGPGGDPNLAKFLIDNGASTVIGATPSGSNHGENLLNQIVLSASIGL